MAEINSINTTDDLLQIKEESLERNWKMNEECNNISIKQEPLDNNEIEFKSINIIEKNPELVQNEDCEIKLEFIEQTEDMSDLDQYKCEVCHETFSDESSLVIHFKKHKNCICDRKKLNTDESVRIRLIELYRNHSLLWNPKDRAHSSRTKRQNAWKEMSVILKQPVSTLKAKMKTLMGTYRSEKSRENKSRITVSNGEDVYESKWFAYKYFDFLKDKNKPIATVDAARSEEPPTVTTEVINDTSSVAITSTTAPQDSPFRTPIINNGRKRKIVHGQSDSDKMMGQALQLLQSSASISNDPYFTYALNLANELRKYDDQTLAHVKRAFANTLFEADMGRISSDPIMSFGSNLQPQQVYLSSGTSSLHGYGSETSSGPTSPALSDSIVQFSSDPLIQSVRNEQKAQDSQLRHDSSFFLSSTT